MNIKNSLFIILALSCPQSYSTTSSLLNAFINYPAEITLASDIVPDAQGILQLDEARIATLQKKYEKNFKFRGYLKYGSRVLQVGLVGVGLYNLGLLNFLMPGKPVILATDPKDIVALKTEMGVVKKNLNRLMELTAVAVNKKPSEVEKIMSAAAPEQSVLDRLSWIWGGVKSISQWVTISLCFAKAAQLNNYVEAAPTFMWFFSNHSLTDRIEVLKRNIKALTDFNIPADYSLEYNRRAIAPAFQTIARNIEELVAFMDYYFDQIDPTFLAEQGMDLQARYLYNISNDFFKKVQTSLHEAVPNPAIVAMVEEFKNDISVCIKKCQFFEKDFVDLD